MHPAYSVILFTTMSGAGYGLLALLALGGAFGMIPVETVSGIIGFGLAFVLIAAGLLASSLHLGHPERAWRALSQWRSSWLSREGVCALWTFVPAGLLAIIWITGGELGFGGVVLALITVVSVLATLYCTGMIYASLRTVPEWNLTVMVPAIYLVCAAATGALLLHLWGLVFGIQQSGMTVVTLLMLIVAGTLKFRYWLHIERMKPQYTAEMATGLGHLGQVRPLEPAHTQPNYIMREMGFKVARKHAAQLQKLTLITLFVVPFFLTLLALTGAGGAAILAAVVAVLAAAVGIVIERWLFFAQARHTAMLYYGTSQI